ncbi:hypothetical protein N7539_008427 [Penicillium diatomitis]|uniref:Uncharacterized protein n=1 Tax=Penicillium diatomitis TaxID=2819901 RepID=A0A9X0BN62_9EURO|nr:uncharacterized protein N7539_008427 [Penicillium diatomitis]KAJ5475361.1 hypothetical protein N7539_008427 [Penicillium diatomitis]
MFWNLPWVYWDGLPEAFSQPICGRMERASAPHAAPHPDFLDPSRPPPQGALTEMKIHSKPLKAKASEGLALGLYKL